LPELLVIVEQIIAEHKIIIQRVQTLDLVVNDASAMMGFDKAKEAFMPGRFNQKKGLQTMRKLLDTIEKGLNAHFKREETILLPAVEKRGVEKFASALRSLFLEHEDFKNRITYTQRSADELISGNLARHLWEASAHDMRTHVSHTRKLLEKHHRREQQILTTMQNELLSESKERLG
jgi:hypothetical protein